jgi:hypothetical protein
MKCSIALLASAAPVSLSLRNFAFAQGVPQTITKQTVAVVPIDPAVLVTDYPTSKVGGSSVFNKANQDVGTVEDLIVTPNKEVAFAVLSVGGFLGMGTKYVVVPYQCNRSPQQEDGPPMRHLRTRSWHFLNFRYNTTH